MNNLRLLIVDDIEDNRLVLRAICKKLDGFEIKEAQNGLEAIETTRSWHPHFILMDIMMPIMDGLEASKIIKKEYPETIIMAVTAVIDPQIEKKMMSIGVSAYIRKPIDKNLVRFKLQNFSSLLNSNKGTFNTLSKKEALNPFSSDIRNFKTIFDITDAEAMMDFGMWILERGRNSTATSCIRIDNSIELFYEFMHQVVTTKKPLSIIAEESFEELFLTMRFQEKIEFSSKITSLTNEMGNDCIVNENFVCIRLKIYDNQYMPVKEEPTAEISNCEIKKIEVSENLDLEAQKAALPEKEVRAIHAKERELLHQNFAKKTTAAEYVQDIGGDIMEEIKDLASLDEEWKDKLSAFSEEPTKENLYDFADSVLGSYVGVINSLFEFEAFAYALTSLRAFLKEKADNIIQYPEKVKMLVMLLEHLGSDLETWREHIFSLQDTQDIHYLDSSFFSSCIQIEGLIDNKEMGTDNNNDNDMEFF